MCLCICVVCSILLLLLSTAIFNAYSTEMSIRTRYQYCFQGVVGCVTCMLHRNSFVMSFFPSLNYRFICIPISLLMIMLFCFCFKVSTPLPFFTAGVAKKTFSTFSPWVQFNQLNSCVVLQLPPAGSIAPLEKSIYNPVMIFETIKERSLGRK